MNRLELSHALSAVLPHAGRTNAQTAVVGIEHRSTPILGANRADLSQGESSTLDSHLYVYATDRYTLGIARVGGYRPIKGQARHLLTTKDASELERWIRPGKVAEKEQPVLVAVEGHELHFGWEGTHSVEAESAVWDGQPAESFTVSALLDRIAPALAWPTEFVPVAINSGYLARFGKAGERINIEFKHNRQGKSGVFIVTTKDFLGAAMNIAYDFEKSPSGILDGWPLIGKEQAA